MSINTEQSKYKKRGSGNGYMCQIIHEIHLDEYTILRMDQLPNKAYSKFRIDGIEYEPVPIYDAPNCIACKSKDSFEGKTVEFI